MQSIWTALKPYKLIGLEIFILGFFIQLVALSVPFIFQSVFDKVLVHQNLSTFHVLGLLLFGLYSFEYGFNLLRQSLVGKMAQSLEVNVGTQLMRHLFSLPLWISEAKGSQLWFSAFQIIDHLGQFLSAKIILTFLDILFSVLFLSIMALYSLPLTGLFLLSIPCYIGLTFAILPGIKLGMHEQSEKQSLRQGLLMESISGLQTLKSLHLESWQSQKWERVLSELSSSNSLLKGRQLWLQESTQFLQKISALLLLLYGVKLVIAQSLTMGQFIAFNMFATRMATPFLKMASICLDWEQGRQAWSNLNQLFELKGENRLKKEKNTLQGELLVSDVTFSYPESSKRFFHHLNLSLVPGEIVGILGASGSGKTTLLRLLQGHYPLERGDIFIDQQPLNYLNQQRYYPSIGWIESSPSFFAGSIKENIILGRTELALEDIEALANQLGLHPSIVSLSQGYDTPINQSGYPLTRNQRQLLAWLRVLLIRPKIILIDEWGQHLEQQSFSYLRNNLSILLKGVTVIMVSRHLSELVKVDKLYSLEGGKLMSLSPLLKEMRAQKKILEQA